MNTQLTATTVIHPDINEITLLVARAVKGITAAGQRVHTITITPGGPNHIATIVHTITGTERPTDGSHRATEPRRRGADTAAGSAAHPGPRYVKLTDLAERTFFSLAHARRLCDEIGIPLHRGGGQGRPHYLSHTDAQRFADLQCPGVRIEFADVLCHFDEGLAVAA